MVLLLMLIVFAISSKHVQKLRDLISNSLRFLNCDGIVSRMDFPNVLEQCKELWHVTVVRHACAF